MLELLNKPGNPLLVFILSAALAAIVAMVSWLLLPRRFKRPKWKCIFLLFGVGAFFPILGPLFVFLGCASLRFTKHKKVTEKVMESNDLTFVQEKLVSPPIFAEGGAIKRLHMPALPKSERLQILTALNSLNSANANRVNQDLLKTEDDDIRLFAFSLLETQETRINEEISQMMKDEQRNLSDRAKIRIHKKLAWLYWELIHLNLVQPDLLPLMIDKSFSYVKKVLAKSPDDYNALLLSGLLYLKRKEYETAKRLFDEAINAGADKTKIYPYLAEIAFKERDFNKVRTLLKDDKELGYISQLIPVIQFWDKHARGL